MEIGQSADKSFAYILGVYLGDGCVTKTTDGYLVFRLNTIDADFADTTRRALNVLSARPVNICTHAVKKSSKPNHSLRFGDQAICKRLQEDTDRKSRIPAYVTGWPKEERLAFIAGIMDSEGFVARIVRTDCGQTNRDYYMGYKSCDAWVPEFVRILESVGIRTGKIGIEKPYKEGYKTPIRFLIKMKSWIDSGAQFNILRKQERVDEWASRGAYESRARYPRRLISETTRRTPATAMI